MKHKERKELNYRHSGAEAPSRTLSGWTGLYPGEGLGKEGENPTSTNLNQNLQIDSRACKELDCKV
jgi:hypothetical protein